MKIIALEKDIPGKSAGQYSQYLKAEAAKVWELYQHGLVREVYYRQDRSSAVLVLECMGLGEARAALNELPLVQAGLTDFELIALKPYPGFARLFTTSETEKQDL
jgi:hypothetical protein